MPIEFTVEPNTPDPVTKAGESLKKLIETPVELGMVNERGLGVIDGQSTADRAKEKINAETVVPENKVLVDSMPSLEVDLPEVRDPESELVNLTQNQQIMTQRALAPGGHDDPAVLLQGLLSQMPGVDNSLAADMTVGTDMALYNLSAKAKRMHNLDERKRRHDERGTSKRGRRRR